MKPMAVSVTTITDIAVKVSFPAILPIEEVIIEGGTGTFSIFEWDGKVHYVLEVETGTRVNKLRIGEIVVASGKDSAGRVVVPSGPLETVSVGTSAVFRGPYK